MIRIIYISVEVFTCTLPFFISHTHDVGVVIIHHDGVRHKIILLVTCYTLFIPII